MPGEPGPTGRTTSSSDSDEDTPHMFLAVHAAAIKELWDAAQKKAAGVTKTANKSMDNVMNKYTHLVEVAHPAELEDLYNRVRIALAAEDGRIRTAHTDLRCLSTETEAVVRTLESALGAAADAEARLGGEFAVAIGALVEEEDVAVQGGPIGGT